MRPRLIALLLLALAPAPALALGEELFGNAPRVKQPEWAVGVVDVVNLQSRVYLQWVNGNESFFFQGDAAALTEAIRKFAAIQDDKKVLVLLPGTGATKSFQGKPVAFDWKLHVPSGIYRAMMKETHPTLTVYVPAAKPGDVPDRAAAAKWVAGLDAPVFRDREAAEAELRKLGRNAKGVLRAALPTATAEQKRRIEKVLKDMTGRDLSDFDIPKGLAVLGPAELAEGFRKGLTDSDTTRRAHAVDRLAALAAFDETIIPTLVKLLPPENHEYVRRMAAYGLGTAGVLAKPALPALKSHLQDADKNVAAACKTAVDQIEAAKESPTREADAKTTKTILEDIRGVIKANGKG